MLDSSEKSRWGYLNPEDLAKFNKRLLEPKPGHFPASLTVDLQIRMTWMYITFAGIVEYASDHLETLTETELQLLELASQRVKDMDQLITKVWDMQAYGHIWMGHFQGPKAALNRFPPEFYKEILDRWCRLRKEVKEDDIQGVRYLDEWMQNFTRRYRTPKTEMQCFDVWTAIHDAGDECHKGEVVEAWRNAINQFRHDKVKIGKIEDAIDGIAARLSSEKLMIKDEASRCGWNSKHSFMVEKKRMFIHNSHLMVDLQLRLKMRAHGEQKEFTLSDLEALAKLREDSITAGLAEKAPMGLSGNPINIWFDEVMFYLPYERICSGFIFNWILYCTKLDHIEFSIMFCMSFGIVEEDTRNWFTDDTRKKIPLFITELKGFVKRRRMKKKKGKGAAEKALSLVSGQNSNGGKENNEAPEELEVLRNDEQKVDAISDPGRSDNSARGASEDSEAKKENYKDITAKDYNEPEDTENIIAQTSGVLKKKQILSRMMRPRQKINGCLRSLEEDSQSENGDGGSTNASSPPISEDNFDPILKLETVIVQEGLNEEMISKGCSPIKGVQHLPINHEQEENYPPLGSGDNPPIGRKRQDDGEGGGVLDLIPVKGIVDPTPVKEDDIQPLSPTGTDHKEPETDNASCSKVVDQGETKIPDASVSETNGGDISGVSLGHPIDSANEAPKYLSKESETDYASCSKVVDQGETKIPDASVSDTNGDEISGVSLEYPTYSANEAPKNLSGVGTPKNIYGTGMIDGVREASPSSPEEKDHKTPDINITEVKTITRSEIMSDPIDVVECREKSFKGKETDMLSPSEDIIQDVTAESDGMKASSERILLKDAGSAPQNTHENEQEYIGIVAQNPPDPRQREEEYFGYIILSEDDNKPPESRTVPFESQYPLTGTEAKTPSPLTQELI
ncbi:uncharacterized protein H6S33_010807 [Morchella sextelata]|uniref:uncharacterized protein n=1 Tax=Morchella sextelata TaxID=1174677 RepID=UPI001D03FF53|nr:uncharacterized protein H6S33_010807 [Morchella sextelata]KAH0611542.1 hypothetical protein H6S33_010807 [Morchella sextelata]